MNLRTETKHDYEKVQDLLMWAFPGREEVFMVAELQKGELGHLHGEFRFHSAFEELG